MKYYYLGAILFFSLVLAACGGSSSSSTDDDSSATLPVTVDITNVNLTAGQPATITYKLPPLANPLTDIEIDLEQTLESANLTVTQ